MSPKNIRQKMIAIRGNSKWRLNQRSMTNRRTTEPVRAIMVATGQVMACVTIQYSVDAVVLKW